MNQGAVEPSSAGGRRSGVGWLVAALGLVAVVWGWATLGIAADAGSVVALAAISLDALPVLAGLWGAAWGYGRLWGLTGSARAAAGAAVLLLLMYLVAWAGGFNAMAGWVVCAVGWGLWVTELLAGKRKAEDVAGIRGFAALSLRLKGWMRSGGWWYGLWGPGVVMLWVAACCPPGTLWRVEALGYDVLSYHLQIPREWVAAGGMVELEHNVYAYLPGLMEAAYAMLAAMRGGDVVGSAYACQLWHGSFALVAAASLVSVVRGVSGKRGAGVAAGAVYLAVPWVLITGSLAYNEQAVAAFAAASVAVVFRAGPMTWRAGAALGLMLAAATLCKLTAGLMVTLPIGGWVVCWAVVRGVKARSRQSEEAKPSALAWRAAACCVLFGVLALVPYFARNTAWTGNPVFPFATDTFGLAHWTEAEAERWKAGHDANAIGRPRAEAWWHHGLTNRGYGAVLGSAADRDATRVADFGREGGLPLLWLAAAVGGVLWLMRRRRCKCAWFMLGWLTWQAMWWGLFTHVQARFLLTAVVPAAILIGLGAAAVAGREDRNLSTETAETPPYHTTRHWLAAALCTVIVFTLAGVSLNTLRHQTAPITLANGSQTPAPVWLLIDGQPEPRGTGLLPTHPINRLPANSLTLVVADNGSLLYLDRPFDYASAFDRSFLSVMLDQIGPDASSEQLAFALRRMGFSHLYVGYSELDRLADTYGVDPALDSDRLRRLTSDWPPAADPIAPAVLYRVPQTAE